MFGHLHQCAYTYPANALNSWLTVLTPLARGAVYRSWEESGKSQADLEPDSPKPGGETPQIADKRLEGTIFVNASNQASGRGLEDIQRALGSTKV